MREERVFIPSAAGRLAGVLHRPEGAAGPRAAFLVLHGFGSTKETDNCLVPCRMLAALGYVALRFDMRGCGESEGTRGRVICLEQVEDTRNALGWLAGRAEVDGARIGCFGSSFGGAVAVYAGGVDGRGAAVVSSGGWGDGESKFRAQHKGEEAWARFSTMLREGLAERARSGRSVMVPRHDIVPIPPHLRGNLKTNAIQEFPIDTVESMYNFRANDVVGRIAPRPLLLLHSAADSVTPTEQSIEMFRHAGQPADLHLFADIDHFMFAAQNHLVRATIELWLAKYFPPVPAAAQ
jgi:alpha-beta hydrolase superfamily lysophospholipase